MNRAQPTRRASGVSCTPWLDGRGRRRAARGVGRAGHRRAARHGRAGTSATTGHAPATPPRAGPTGGTGTPAPGAEPQGVPPHAAPRATPPRGAHQGRPQTRRAPDHAPAHPHGLDRRAGAGHPAAILPPRVADDDRATGRTPRAIRPPPIPILAPRVVRCLPPSIAAAGPG